MNYLKNLIKAEQDAYYAKLISLINGSASLDEYIDKGVQNNAREFYHSLRDFIRYSKDFMFYMRMELCETAMRFVSPMDDKLICGSIAPSLFCGPFQFSYINTRFEKDMIVLYLELAKLEVYPKFLYGTHPNPMTYSSGMFTSHHRIGSAIDFHRFTDVESEWAMEIIRKNNLMLSITNMVRYTHIHRKSSRDYQSKAYSWRHCYDMDNNLS